MFPLKDYKYNIPVDNQPGAFGFKRKYDFHTGIDLYCEENTPVYAITNGIAYKSIPFTGDKAGSPWWENTDALFIECTNDNELYSLKTFLYGEIIINPDIKLYYFIKEGDLIGHVKRVLKNNKGIVPSTSMLHMELYGLEPEDAVWWYLNEEKPKELEDITPILQHEYKITFNENRT